MISLNFTDWANQLLAESIGKENKGITPVKALGATAFLCPGTN